MHINVSDYMRLKEKSQVFCLFCFIWVCLFLGNLPYAKQEQIFYLLPAVWYFLGKM